MHCLLVDLHSVPGLEALGHRLVPTHVFPSISSSGLRTLTPLAL